MNTKYGIVNMRQPIFPTWPISIFLEIGWHWILIPIFTTLKILLLRWIMIWLLVISRSPISYLVEGVLLSMNICRVTLWNLDPQLRFNCPLQSCRSSSQACSDSNRFSVYLPHFWKKFTVYVKLAFPNGFCWCFGLHTLTACWTVFLNYCNNICFS